ncbi:MAG: hypothetical protein J6S85_09295 [Methanobrevibacter sp.]|nr:hypothetical protein [Methanobrevibacter sp.]
MVKTEMNDTVKRRFNFRRECPICKQAIHDYDDIQYIKFQHGRLRMYSFFHTSCLVNHIFEDKE